MRTTTHLPAMMRTAARLMTGAGALCVALASLAQQPPPPPGTGAQPMPNSAGSADNNTRTDIGARIAQQGVPERNVAACASCHGAQGGGMAAGGFPRLAAQSGEYLARQLRSYADGSRNNAVMTPIAKGLNEQQIGAVAAHYGSLKPASTGNATTIAAAAAPASAPPAANPNTSGNNNNNDARTRGARLASIGDESLQLQACANCHGPAGIGEPPAIPYLAGQHASYLTAALAEWKNGNRKNDPSGQMPQIAQRLSDTDVAALAGYYAAQTAPGPRLQSPEARRPAAAPATASSGSSGSAAPPAGATGQGVGTEAGSPLTGGNQTPGGSGTTGSVNPTGGGNQQRPAR